MNTYEIWYYTISCKSPKNMGLKLQNHYSFPCTQTNAYLEKVCPATFWCLWERHNTWIMPRKLYGTHWTNQETHHTFINDEHIWRSWWTSTFWWRTQQYSDGQNVHPDFQVKVSGAQDTWHNIIVHPPTATRAQELYK